MLPDVPKLKATLRKQIVKKVRDAAMEKNAFVNSIQRIVQHEGNRATILTQDGFRQDIKFEEVCVCVDHIDAEGKPLGPESIIGRMSEAMQQVEESKSRLLFSTIEQAIENSCNAIVAGGYDLTQELWFQAIERIHLDFDEEEKPIYPTLVVNSSMRDKFMRKLEQWDTDPVFSEKWDALIERKREEWLDRENHRKLVD